MLIIKKYNFYDFPCQVVVATNIAEASVTINGVVYGKFYLIFLMYCVFDISLNFYQSRLLQMSYAMGYTYQIQVRQLLS